MASPRRRPARRARRTLLWAGALFVLAQAAVSIVLDYWWLEVRFPDGAHVLSQALAQARSPDVVCLGSSRFGLGFRPEIVAPLLRERTGQSDLGVFNGTVSNGDLVTSAFILDHLLAQDQVPRVVVLEVSPETLAAHNPQLGDDILRIMTWTSLPRFLKEAGPVRAQRTLAWSARLAPIHLHRRRLREALLGIRHASDLEYSQGPGMADGLNWQGNFRLLECRDPKRYPEYSRCQTLAVGAALATYRIGGVTAQALRHILDSCHERQIAVLLVGAPVAVPVRELYTPAVLTAYHAYTERQAAKWGARFVDYHDRFAGSLFADGYHMLFDGCREFSCGLTKEALAPLILSKTSR